MAETHDLQVTHGESLVRVFTWTTADGARQPLTGLWRPIAQIRAYSGGGLLLDLTPHLEIVGGIVDKAGQNGEAVRLNVPADLTRRINALGRWDLHLVDHDGGEAVRGVVIVTGLVRYTPAVTREPVDV